MADNGAQLVAAQMAYDNEKKNPVVAWLLWFFLGGFGVHRFYLGNVVRGLMLAGFTAFMFLLDFIIPVLPMFLVFVAVVIDGILMFSDIKRINGQIQHNVFQRFGVGSPAATFAAYQQPTPAQPQFQQPAQLENNQAPVAPAYNYVPNEQPVAQPSPYVAEVAPQAVEVEPNLAQSGQEKTINLEKTSDQM